ncbi:DUF1178 family protein [Temperatibacter marinus]|uniref:DUF1178 family protein n=1 Tax=Temperatibacter marinus TaxID=1456591 RepID=A0AA52H8E8_9PROT|nr:DUF1178 family protein [Temperatibacter marinus]WND01372.1 DUF1178 family protein [Temperatibacter marinus]
MIVFDLKCKNSHQFEVWFRSSQDFDGQRHSGFLECPYCGDKDISKAIMAPNIAVKSNQKDDAYSEKYSEVSSANEVSSGIGKSETLTERSQKRSSAAGNDTARDKARDATESKISTEGRSAGLLGKDMPQEMQEAFQEAVKAVSDHVEKTFDHVGKEFAEEARKIHYGESQKRPIYGEATPQEAEDLLEEGVDILPLPLSPKQDS